MDRRVKERLVGASILAVLIVLIVPELLSGPPGPAPAAVGPRLPASAVSEPVRNVTVDLATSKAPEPDPAAAETAASGAQPPVAPSKDDAASAGAGADASAPAGTGGHGSPADPPPADPLQEAGAPRTEASGPVETAAPAPTLDSPAKSPATAKPAVAAKPAVVAKAALPAQSPVAVKAATAAKPSTAGRPWAVQLGSFASHANADKLVRQLKAQGFSVYIVPGGSGPSLRYRVRIGPMADRGAATQALAKLKSTGHAASLVAPAL
jgi:DedD protein